MKSTPSQIKRRIAKGFTLVEVAIVVAIGLLLLAGIAGANRIIASNKANDEIGELKVASTNLQKAFASSPNFQSLGTNGATVARNLRVFSEERNSATAGQLTTRWNTALTLNQLAATATQPPMAVIQVAQVPSYECSSIVPQVADTFYAIQITAGAAAATAPSAPPAAVNATFVKTTSPSTGPSPVDVAALAAACEAATGNANINYYLAK